MMARALKMWGGLLMGAGGSQQRYVVAAPTKRLALELLHVWTSRNMSRRYFDDYWSQTGNREELALLSGDEPGVWQLEGRYPGSLGHREYTKVVSLSDLHEARKEWAREDAAAAAQRAHFRRLSDEREAATVRLRAARESLTAAALNMVEAFPRGGTEREDAYVRLFEAAQELKAAEEQR